MMKLYRSNRLEVLAEQLAQQIASHSFEPLEQRTIVVQSHGLAQWLTFFLSSRFGCWANPDFPFPRRFFERIFQQSHPDDDTAFVEANQLIWGIKRALPTIITKPEFASIASYLDDDPHGVKEMQLCFHLGDLFDRYMTYRPQLIEQWTQGQDNHWQALMWRHLVGLYGQDSFANEMLSLIDRLKKNPQSDLGLQGQPIFFFGISTLPPLYLDLLTGLAQTCPVHLFIMSPSSQYWADILPKKVLARRDDIQQEDTVDFNLDEGHPLLASCGKLGRDFQYHIEERAAYQESGEDLYRDPSFQNDGKKTLLEQLQTDILHLEHPNQPEVSGDFKQTTEPGVSSDNSIQIHNCHHPMREAQVLHDTLLGLFQEDPSLEPNHVVVMTPDIKRYAPFIDAVFSTAHSSDTKPWIPHTIADQHDSADGLLLQIFEELVKTCRGTFQASQIFSLLDYPAIQDKLKIRDNDTIRIAKWVEKTNIRWGLDEDHRQDETGTLSSENTWDSGLMQLHLGIATQSKPGDHHQHLPTEPSIEGEDGELLGLFSQFIQRLRYYRKEFLREEPVSHWCSVMRRMVTDFLEESDDAARFIQNVFATLDRIQNDAERMSYTSPLSFSAFQNQLFRDLNKLSKTKSFLSGGVLFCEMVPLRSIPFSTVCLMGMDQGAFPRQRAPLSFDLIHKTPMIGDRTAQMDDRYLFLEAILSARKNLIITYSGQSPRSNEQTGPSTVVTELLESLRLPDGSSPEKVCVLHQHPLHPFHPQNFSNGTAQSRHSFSIEGRRLATQLLNPAETNRPALHVPRPSPSAPESDIGCAALLATLQQPQKSYCQHQLFVDLPGSNDEEDDDDPVQLGALHVFKLTQQLLDSKNRDAPIEDVWRWLRAKGALPAGDGHYLYEDPILRTAKDIWTMVTECSSGIFRPPERFSVQREQTRLHGAFANLVDDTQIFILPSKAQGHRLLPAWIHHLCAQIQRPSQFNGYTHLFAPPKDSPRIFHGILTPVKEPKAALDKLVQLFYLARSGFIPAFKHASGTYANHHYGENKPMPTSLKKAKEDFEYSEHRVISDWNDPYIQFMFRHSAPDEAVTFLFSDPETSGSEFFRECAATLYEDLYQSLEVNP